MSIKSFFCDNAHLCDECSMIIAKHLIGDDMLKKVRLRYDDLKENFNAVSFDEWDASGPFPLWKFSSGLTPYMDFDDTSVVPIPITNGLFKLADTVVSFDFPVWFNMEESTGRRVFMLFQDPIPRNIKWYRDCEDALCSTVFGMHNPLWREKGNGGKRMWLLIQALIQQEIGVYLTDCNKLAMQSRTGEMQLPSPQQISAYRDMLKDEIELVNPSLIVAFGNTASSVNESFGALGIPTLSLPHFSGLAQGKIREFFNWPEEKLFPIDVQAELYCNVITKNLSL